MNVRYRTEIRYNRLPELVAKVPNAVGVVVRKAGFDIQREAKRFCPVDTGALRASITTETDLFSAEIAPHVDYAGYLEFGTIKMAAQPYMRPAADVVEPKYIEALEQLFARL